jgi:hypothetical protein
LLTYTLEKVGTGEKWLASEDTKRWHSIPNWSPLAVTDLDVVCAGTRANIQVTIAVA